MTSKIMKIVGNFVYESHGVECKRPDTKENILYNCICIKMKAKQCNNRADQL